MAVTYVAGAKGNNGITAQATTLSLTIPASAAVGDTAVVSVCTQDTAATFTPPSGWTTLHGPDNNGTSIRSLIYVKDLIAGDPGATLSFNPSSSGWVLGTVDVFRGTAAASIFTVTPAAPTSATALVAPAITTTAANTWIYELWTSRRGGAAAATYAVPAGFTATQYVASAHTVSPNFQTQGMYLTAPGAAGSYGGDTTTSSLGVNANGYTIAIPPVAPGSATATGTISLGGIATPVASGTAAGTVTLGGTATLPAATAAGTVTLGGTATATATAAATAVGSVDLAGIATGPPPPQYIPHPWVVDQQKQGLQVAVYNAAYTLLGFINDYESCAVTFQHMDTGTGTLVLAESQGLANHLINAGSQVVPVVVTDRAGRRWTGRVEQSSVDKGNGSTPTPPGKGTITVTLVDEWPWLKRILASPFGASTALTYPAGTPPEFDVRTGPIDTVVKGYISDASTRIWDADSAGNLLGPVIVAPALGGDTSPTVTLQAKWTPIADLVTDTLRVNNRTLTTTLWLPGDPQPSWRTTAPLTQPTVIVDIQEVANNPQIIWTDNSFLSRRGAVKAPTAYRGVIGGSGSGITQVFDVFVDTDLQASLGRWGFPEAYFSARSATSGVTTQQDAEAQLVATEGGVAIVAAVADGVPWTYGQDYAVGDVVGVRAFGLDIRQRVISVQLVDDRASGYRMVPTIGDDQATLTVQQRLFRKVSALGTRVQQLQTGL